MRSCVAVEVHGPERLGQWPLCAGKVRTARSSVLTSGRHAGVHCRCAPWSALTLVETPAVGHRPTWRGRIATLSDDELSLMHVRPCANCVSD
jgi:hypothetical protein